VFAVVRTSEVRRRFQWYSPPPASAAGKDRDLGHLAGRARAFATASLAVAVVLLAAVCFFRAFGTVIVAQGRTLFPDRLAGRGAIAVNTARRFGLSVLPALVD
jgi:hypothetical protein